MLPRSGVKRPAGCCQLTVRSLRREKIKQKQSSKFSLAFCPLRDFPWLNFLSPLCPSGDSSVTLFWSFVFRCYKWNRFLVYVHGVKGTKRRKLCLPDWLWRQWWQIFRKRERAQKRRTPVGLLDGPSENDEDSDENFTADHRRWLKGYPKGARPMPLGVLSCCHRDANTRKGTAAIARGHVHNASRTQIDRKRLRQRGLKHIQHKKVNNKKKKKRKDRVNNAKENKIQDIDDV